MFTVPLKISGGSADAGAGAVTGEMVEAVGCVSGAVVGGGVAADRAASGWLELDWFADGIEVTGALDASFGGAETALGICAEVFAARDCEAFAGARGLALTGRGVSTRGWSARE